MTGPNQTHAGAGQEHPGAGQEHPGSGQEQPGSDREQAADELRLLALALLDRAEPAARVLLTALRERGAGADHPVTCTWCPLCATVGLLRGERPELAAAIASHAEGLVSALRAALAPEPTQPAGPTDAPDRSAARRVERIDVRPAGGAGA